MKESMIIWWLSEMVLWWYLLEVVAINGNVWIGIWPYDIFDLSNKVFKNVINNYIGLLELNECQTTQK